MSRTYTCIVCPEGCQIAVGREYQWLSLQGLLYVRQERENPTRNIATPCVLQGEMPLVPVKTASPIPKDKNFEVMAL